MALNATVEFYDAQECATKVLPAVSTALIDKEKPVRDQAFKALNTFVKKVQEFADNMPETAIEPATASPNSEEAKAQATSMTGVLGGATKGLAGWAVSSIQSRFSTPSGEIGNPVNTVDANTPTTTSQQNIATPPLQKSASVRFDIQSIEPDVTEETNAWDDEDIIPFDTNSEATNSTSDFASPVTQTETISPLSNDYTTTSPVSTFGVSKAAQGSMKLGHSKPKKIDDGGLDSMISALKDTKDERKTELERKREERRQRMAELREKKKGGIGAKRVQGIGL
ncbi:hypothetical protein RMCBS344292_05628 [Rhizopus microsporus]|nr:hypothetical protein RMCBS344292_05628 [Rhizopus microsporus]